MNSFWKLQSVAKWFFFSDWRMRCGERLSIEILFIDVCAWILLLLLLSILFFFSMFVNVYSRAFFNEFLEQMNLKYPKNWESYVWNKICMWKKQQNSNNKGYYIDSIRLNMLPFFLGFRRMSSKQNVSQSNLCLKGFSEWFLLMQLVFLCVIW